MTFLFLITAAGNDIFELFIIRKWDREIASGCWSEQNGCNKPNKGFVQQAFTAVFWRFVFLLCQHIAPRCDNADREAYIRSAHIFPNPVL